MARCAHELNARRAGDAGPAVMDTFDAETNELHARLAALGFRLECLGGNCCGFLKYLDAVHYVQLYTEPLWAPTADDEPIYVGTLGPDDEAPPDLRTFASLREAVEALEREPAR